MDKAETPVHGIPAASGRVSDSPCLKSWIKSTWQNKESGMRLSPKAVSALWHTLVYLEQEIRKLESQQ